jgi:hypothetical protein
MRAKEFINESPRGKMPKSLDQASVGSYAARDVGGYDRTYHMNRLLMAAAMADGSSATRIQGMDPASFVEKFNVIFPYTDAEHLMMMAAMATIPTDGHELTKRSKSKEPEDTYHTSPVPDRKKLKK